MVGVWRSPDRNRLPGYEVDVNAAGSAPSTAGRHVRSASRTAGCADAQSCVPEPGPGTIGLMKRALVVVVFLVGCSGGSGGTGGPSFGDASGIGGSSGFHTGIGGIDGVAGASAGGAGPAGTAGAGGQPAAGGGTSLGAIGGGHGGAGHGGAGVLPIGGASGHAGAPGAGGTKGAGGAGGAPVACTSAGFSCPDPTSCCQGSTCVAFSAGQQLCAGNCMTGSDCNSGCCAPLSNSTTMVCVPADNCISAPPQPETGTVIAVDSNYQHMLIQTASGQKLFSSVLDCFVFAGTTVTFDQPTAACISNTLTYSTGTCSVTCDGTGYPGQIVTATTGGEYSIATQSGTGMYRAMLSCFLVSQGNQVVFGSSPGLCLTNYFFDTTTSGFCDVYCNQ